MTPEETYQWALEWRGIETPCNACSGSGQRLYGSCSTWRGGISGQAMTHDVCDKCWGSGDSDRPWTNLREIQGNIQKEIDKGLEKVLERRIGAEYYSSELFTQLCEVLERETRKRSVDHNYKFMVRRIINMFKNMGKT